MTFGEKLQKLRARAGLSQDALAELLDVSRQAVSKWERNEAMPEAEKLVRISRQFGVSTDYLLFEEMEEPEMPRAPVPAAGLGARVRRWYRDRGYLLGWVLAAWGGVWLLWEIVDTVKHAAKLLELNDSTPEFWKSILKSDFLPDAIPPVLMSAAGVVLALWGRRMGGRLRWHHLGWLPVLVGLLGTGFTLPWIFRCLAHGLVWRLAFVLRAASSGALRAYAAILSEGLWGTVACLLVTVLGLAILLLGRRQERKHLPGKIE